MNPQARASEPREVWLWSLSWLLKPPTSAEKRARQTALIGALVADLRAVDTIPGLHDRYTSDSRWCLAIARRMFPVEWPTVGVHACTAAAHAIRYVELLTRKTLDARSLPRWISEFAVW